MAPVSDNDLAALPEIVDAALQELTIEQAVNWVLNFDATRESLKKAALEAADASNQQLSEEAIRKAIDKMLAQSYGFVPHKGFGYSLAGAYASRDKATPFAVAVGSSAMAFVALSAISAYIGENDAEKKVATLCGVFNNLTQELDTKMLLTTTEPGLQARLERSIEAVRAKKEDARELSEEFCDGKERKWVTTENYESVNTRLSHFLASLGIATGEVNNALEILAFNATVTATRQDLEAVMQEITSQKPLKPMAERAKVAYQSGIASLTGLNEESVKTAIVYQKALEEISKEAKQFWQLSEKLERAFNSITATAREEGAATEAAKLYAEGQAYVSSAEVRKLESIATRLEGLDSILQMDYTIRIVDRQGQKSGIDRYHTDKNGRRISGFYLIVEAIDQSGKALKIPVTSIETGETETVAIWGERVPQDVYERVRTDKSDDGIIQEKLLGRKPKGYAAVSLTDTKGRPLQREGQITKW